jgi:RNA polymerase sigma-70 factor, ECF subfamily
MDGAMPPPAEITRILQEWQAGSREALDRLMPIVYNELRVIASRQLAREWRHDRLQTTAVVNEAYLKLFGQREVDWQNRSHFFAIAAQLMRRIVVDHARREQRQNAAAASPTSRSPRPARSRPPARSMRWTRSRWIARSRNSSNSIPSRRGSSSSVFGGLSAAVLRVSPATVKRDWAVAKGWLHAELTANG